MNIRGCSTLQSTTLIMRQVTFSIKIRVSILAKDQTFDTQTEIGCQFFAKNCFLTHPPMLGVKYDHKQKIDTTNTLKKELLQKATPSKFSKTLYLSKCTSI